MFPSGFDWDSIPSIQEVPVSGAQGERLSACATEEKPTLGVQGELLTVNYFCSLYGADLSQIVTMTQQSIR